jgi:hypothetical protein
VLYDIKKTGKKKPKNFPVYYPSYENAPLIAHDFLLAQQTYTGIKNPATEIDQVQEY